MKLIFKHFPLCVLLLLLLGSCKPEPSPPVLNIEIKKEKDNILTKANEEGRVIWQKPETVIQLLGDLTDLTVADIGAGSGFFTFRMALKSEKVIAVEIDTTMIRYLETVKQKLPEEIHQKIETRLALPDDPRLKKEEVELVVIINTIGYISNRIDYLQKLKRSLKQGGRIMILDFKAKKLPINAPADEFRVSLMQIEQDLTQAGFSVVKSDDRTLDYQYIVFASK